MSEDRFESAERTDMTRSAASGEGRVVHEVHVNGVRLAYRTWGAADAPPVLLLHCLGADGEDWRGVVGQLAATHRVYALDQRGHGLSDQPGEYSFESWRDDAIGFLEALGLERVTVIAHSLGAMTALLLASHRPGLVERLVLEEMAPPRVGAPRQAAPEPPPGPLGFDWRAKLAVVAQRNDPDPAWWSALSAITAPTLVIGGGPTSHIPQPDLAEVATVIPDCTLLTIDGAGHLVHEERPHEFLDAVRTFLNARS